jgi:RNA polymerase sigma factor (sigma-70 family)
MSPCPQSDAELIARSISNPTAFRNVFERHFDGVWGYLRQRVGPSLADDLTSETFVVAFGSRDRFRGEVSARPWLLGIASNLAARHWRAESRRLSAYARTGTPAVSDLDEDGLLARVHASNQAPVIAQAIARLSPADRETLLLSALAGLSDREVAEALDVSTNAVSVRLHRIRAALAPLLRNHDALEPR